MGFGGSGKGGYGGGGGGGATWTRREGLTGMVKSYNRKGFGFIMCQDLDVDVYFSRESLAPQLQTSDLAGRSHALAGEYVTFDVFRFPDGKMQARNLRPVGECNITRGPDGFGGATMKGGAGKGCYGGQPPPPPPQQQQQAMPMGGMYGMGGGIVGGAAAVGGHTVEDRTLDWYCAACGERNFTKRFECFKCKAPRPAGAVPPCAVNEPAKAAPPPPPRRTLSPHAGSRAMRDTLISQRLGGGGGGAARPSRSASRRKRRRSSSSSSNGSSSSSESSSDKKKKRRRKKKSGKKRKARSSSSSSSSGGDKGARSSGAGGSKEETTSPEIEKAKSEVLEKLMKIKQVEPREQRIKDWRAILREWHPDKNPDRVEVATAVFQFLQKGKLLIDA